MHMERLFSETYLDFWNQKMLKDSILILHVVQVFYYIELELNR